MKLYYYIMGILEYYIPIILVHSIIIHCFQYITVISIVSFIFSNTAKHNS